MSVSSTSTEITLDMTLVEAKNWLRARVDEGARCPCCTQYAKVYRRSLPSATARTMIAMYRRNEGRDFLYLPAMLDTINGVAYQGGYATYGHHWGLMEHEHGERPDGSSRVGWWRLTALGRRFTNAEVAVPRYAYVYNGRCLRVDGPAWSISQALGTKFDYDELMSPAGVRPPHLAAVP